MSKKYHCPYCTNSPSYERSELIEHIELKHEDLIPEGWTATRVVFKIVNGKDHGTCIVCKKETKWNETRGKYERLCDDPRCRHKLREAALKNHIKVYGKPTLLNDASHQKKMLEGRKIAGKYNFRDGGQIGYVGSFERKLLEFFDKVLECSSKDIIEPGPTLEYRYHGRTCKWITDFLYVPYNLVIEVKDGGDNPNKREMESYREKQIQKEKMITNLGTYNYIRVTNNNFLQLLELFAEMKYALIDDNEENRKAVFIRINEDYDYILLQREPIEEDSTMKTTYTLEEGEKLFWDKLTEECISEMKDEGDNTTDWSSVLNEAKQYEYQPETLEEGVQSRFTYDELKDFRRMELEIFRFGYNNNHKGGN